MAQTRSSGGTVPPRPAAATKLRTVEDAGSATVEAPIRPSGGAMARAGSSEARVRRSGYVVPLAHVRLPEPVVTVGFFAALGAAVVAGMVDAPVAVLGVVAVAIARHYRS